MNIFKWEQEKKTGFFVSFFYNKKTTMGMPGSAFCTQKTTTGFTLVYSN